MSGIKDVQPGDELTNSAMRGILRVVEVRNEKEFGKPVKFYVLQMENGYKHTTDEYHLEMNYKRAKA